MHSLRKCVFGDFHNTMMVTMNRKHLKDERGCVCEEKGKKKKKVIRGKRKFLSLRFAIVLWVCFLYLGCNACFWQKTKRKVIRGFFLLLLCL